MSKYLIAGLAALTAIAIIIWGGVAAIGKIDTMVATAATSAKNERDAHWRAEIEKSNAEAQAKITANLKATMAAQDAARDQVAAAEHRASELETKNNALPDSEKFGISRGRVRLLNGQ